jgi:glycogen(starch) synthase
VTVTFLAMTGLRATAVVAQSDLLLQHGTEVSLVTADPGAFETAGLDERVRVLAVDEEATLLWRAEGVVVRRVPEAVAAAAGSVLRPRRPAWAERVAAVQTKGSNVLHHTGFLKPYKVVRPYVLWRAAARTVVPRLELAPDDEVVVVDSQAIPLGWRLARRHPWLRVGFALDRDRYVPRDPATPAEAADL